MLPAREFARGRTACYWVCVRARFLLLGLGVLIAGGAAYVWTGRTAAPDTDPPTPAARVSEEESTRSRTPRPELASPDKKVRARATTEGLGSPELNPAIGRPHLPDSIPPDDESVLTSARRGPAPDAGAPLTTTELDALFGEARAARQRGDERHVKELVGRIAARDRDGAAHLMAMLACAEGNAAHAQRYAGVLAVETQQQLRARCAGSGVTIEVREPRRGREIPGIKR
jgi:hypothetical protein